MNFALMDRYRGLLLRLDRQRAAAGGSLSQEVESDWADQLSEIWNQLTPEERSQLEQQIAEAAS